MQPVNVTPSAANYLCNTCKREAKPGIKLQVKGGGCAGFSYEYEFVDSKEDNDDVVIPLDEQYYFVIDSMSLLYVIGTTLDYEEKIGQSSLVLKNPNEVSSCGCGKSFSV